MTGANLDRIDAARGKTADTAWQKRARCADPDIDIDIFFTEKGGAGSANEARAICRRCPVRDACLDYALETPVERFGIWGGLTSTERRPHLRARKAA